MELLEETASNRVEDKNDENKNEDNSLKENGVQEPLPKKKFANTNFALKMKNKRKAEKLNKLDTKETLSSCKQVSIDVTRLNSNPVPIIINAVESKNRRKKRSQWKLGITKKRKKSIGKDININPLNKGLANGVDEGNHNNDIIQAAESLKIKQEDSIPLNDEKKKSPNATNSESLPRRKSLRSVTTIISDTSLCEPEIKVDLKTEEENFSCRRTEPFIGKLITKEARDEIANRILKGETEPKAKSRPRTESNNKSSEKDVESKESKTEDLIKSLSQPNTNTETNDKAGKKAEKSTKDTMMDTDKEVTQLSRITLKLTETKESVKIEETSCSRTIPFVGKTVRKLSADVPERPSEIDSSTNQSDANSLSKDNTINLMDSSAIDTTEPFDSSRDINTNGESTLGIKILSVSSLKDDEGVKDVFLPEKVDESASQPTVIPLKGTNVDSDHSNKIQTDLDASAKKIKTKLKLSKNTKLDASLENVEEQSYSLPEKTDTAKETRRSSSSSQKRSNLRSSISSKSGCRSEDISSKSTTSHSTLEDVQNPWSCQRVVPFQGKKNYSFTKQPTAENVLNQTESSAPNISSVLSDDLIATPEPVADKLVSKEDNQLDENISQDKIENDVKNKNSEKAESATEPSNSLDANSSNESPVLNGEWKFRRKRQILSSDDDNEEKETQKTKKVKVKSSSDAKTHIDKKCDSQCPSPDKTICSFLSTKCTKHEHHSQSDNGAALNDVKPKAYVLLTRLEDMKDLEVKEYIQKTDLINTIKRNYRRIMINKITDDTSKPDTEKSISTSVQATKDDVVPSIVPEAAQESDSSTSFRPSKENEDTSSHSTSTSISTRRRQMSTSRTFSESPILHTKRKKRPVNYLEEFSDTDEDRLSSSKRQLRSQQLSRGLLRDQVKSGAPGIFDTDEDDMEVEEFSRIGRQNRAEESNQEDSEHDANSSKTQSIKAKDVFKKARARCKSVVEMKISDIQRYPMRSKTPHIGMSTEPNVVREIDNDKLEEDIVQGLNNMEKTINKLLEKRGVDPHSTSLAAANKTPSLSHPVSNECISSTPSVPISKSMTSKKILGTPSHDDIASPQCSRSTTPRRSVTFQRNELLAKVTKSASELLEDDRKKEINLKDIRVQLIKLEAVCSDYKDYSAGEIELLTNKYIDMLMNSNFACDTWRVNPIKLATTYARTVNLRGDEGDSDFDSQDNEPLPFEEVQVPMDSAELDYDTTAEQNINQSSRQKTSKMTNKQPIELDSTIASLSQNTNSHEKTFGAITISEVLSQPAANEEDVDNNRSVDSNAEEDANENEDSIGHSKNSDLILVNGTEVHACTFCNKIFVEKELLDKHIAEGHKNSDKPSISSSKTTGKHTPGPASSKKGKSKKFRYSESLKCTICCEAFVTKELLFDHIMTHNETDLQEAYKAAKLAKDLQSGEINVSEDLENDKAKDKKQKKSIHRKSTDSALTVSGEELAVDNTARASTSIADATSQQVADLSVVTAQSSTSNTRALTVCQCHAHELATQDLHIEMVLLCTACNVIYRRRDCFEVHFRTNAECRRKRANSEVTKAPKLFCSGCRCILNSLIEMRSHLEEHATKNCTGTVTFLCNICKVAFFGVGGIFYSHWFHHAKSPNFVASRYSFPKLSVVSVLEDVNGTMTTSKSQEGFFYIAEHVCRECRLPFSSDPELQKHKQHPCQITQPVAPRVDSVDNNRLQMIKLICDLCKKYYVSKDNFDKHCNDRNHLKTPITKFSRLPINATEQVFVCSLCRGLSKTLDEMKEHWKRVHSPIMELYTCKTCNVVPSNDMANYTYENFERHCRMVHKSEVITCLVYFVTARYVCNICKFGFETEKSMKEHELMHQKKSGIQNAPASTATVSLALGETQSSTFYVADNPQPDGGRRLHPVVVQYPNINGIVGPLAMSQCPLPSQPQLQLPSQANASMTAINNQIVLPSTSVIRMPNTTVNQDMSTELRKALTSALQNQTQPQNATIAQQQQQQQQQQQTNANKVVETIELDSRSNSPVLDSPAASTSSSSNSVAAAKKAYMTKVNPNFESIMQTTASQANSNSTDTLNYDRNRPNRDENSTPAEVDTLTPQPFEVVLVTDELSENSNQDKDDNLGSTSDGQPQQQAPEIIETKSFLRVRSVAELQSIKIHLCSICGMNFDTPHAFEQHEKQHRTMGEVGRSTPVQMISPMVAPGTKETTNESNSTLMTRIQRKLAVNMANGPPAPTTSTNVNTRVMPSTLPHQPVLPPQQHQSWYPPSTTSTMSSVNYATSQSMQPPQQHSVLRQAISSAPHRSSYANRPPPPPYPSTSNSMVAPGRPSAIQLPERSTTGNIPPQTKRPSGAATRIPQQSLPSYDEIRQTVSSVWGYSSGGSVTYNPAPQQSSVQKTYDPVPNTVNYSTVNGPVNYQSVPQSQPQQQQPPKSIIYTCKHPNCFYRSASLAGIRAHETIHLIPQQGQQLQQMPTTSANHHQQQQQLQQQQQQSQRLPVSQMPERTRHAVPSSRPPPSSSNQDKRITCRICNLHCATSIELIEHVSSVHSGANQVCCYVCDYCPSPLIFDTEEQLRKHMNFCHNHSCDICGKRYPSKEDLLLHTEVHMRRP